MKRRLLVLELEAIPSRTFTNVRVIVGGNTACTINAGWQVPAEQAIIEAQEALAKALGTVFRTHAPITVMFTQDEEGNY